MNKISQWYTNLESHTFSTLFIKMTPAQVELFLNLASEFNQNDLQRHNDLKKLLNSCQEAIDKLPGKVFVGLDNCAPTDNQKFNQNKNHSNAFNALKLLNGSLKIKQSFKNGEDTLIFRPYRRMNKTREFRLFIQNRQICGISQYNLERHFRRLEKHKQKLFDINQKFIQKIAPLLPEKNIVIDTYLTGKQKIIIIDMNNWGEPTNSLLFRWDEDWSKLKEIRLMKPAFQIKGDINISY